jgi:cell division GTPase FtsZ
MEKTNVIGIGCGGCGNHLVSTFLDMDKRYTGIFMNTNMSEMENLRHFNR